MTDRQDAKRKSGGRPSLPPLDYLLAFEAAAEEESFARASERLHLSETAISRKVRLLEQHHGTALFLRGSRSVRLTPQGQRFLADIKPALRRLREASRRIASEGRPRPVTLAATNSVAVLWLMPRLQAFRRINPQIRILLVASDNDEECLSDSVDLAILRGSGEWPGFASRQLFGETVFPVCSPVYLAAHPEAECVEGLARQDLIGVTSAHSEWMTWSTWLQAVGAPGADPAHAAAFNTYPLAIQAAVDGLGVALGWAHLVDPYIDSGALLRPLGEREVCTEQGYHLLCATASEDFDERRVVRDWLAGLAAPPR
ncbi:LysR substrate-binding domain-containing protein [Pontibaca methylaminivorans]|uniref:DNA-binding transcriptional regulator, LysR family n=1 Tax=Pontibaca methylaminivorans TaxID=515897 RepID=A0A1R3WW75_9RHOB|nr:LysR substrate-binding domain-containing protein [Pontibaca methylaminivorans]SIT82326.1 DNA-binding transcriptional regulator, LysR family [Pontibaca methylaminivorans]